MSFQINNSFNSVPLPLQALQGSEDLLLSQIIENKDEKTCLNFLKNRRLDPLTWKWTSGNTNEISLIKICLDNSWNATLNWLSNRGANLMPELVQAISLKDPNSIEMLLKSFKGNINDSINGIENETLLWHALNEKNYQAASLLIEHGASLKQPLPHSLDSSLKNQFKTDFFKNKYFYEFRANDLFNAALSYDYENSLAYAIASHYYLKDPAALDVLLKNPQAINFNVIKVFIQLADVSAFNKALIPYMKLLDMDSKDEMTAYIKLRNRDKDRIVERRKADLLHYALRDLRHFSLMGFDFDYILERFDILKSILSLNPGTRTLDKNMMTTFEIAQYVKFVLPEETCLKFEPLFEKIFDDPSRFHEVWALQRLLINNLGARLPLYNEIKDMEVAVYPVVANHFRQSLNNFLPNNNLLNNWIFPTPKNKCTVDECLKWIDEKKILKFFTGWTGGNDFGHAINAVIYDKILFICNRGSGSTINTSGVCIYEIKDNDTLKEIIQLFFERSAKTTAFIILGLEQHPRLKRLKTIPGNSQKVGNCVWLSEKMGHYACFISSFLKQGHSLEESLTLAKTLFKQWSEFDRLNLLKAYIEHPYHTRNGLENENEGILFKKVVQTVISRAPRRLRSKYFDLILQRLSDIKLQAALHLSNKSDLLIDLKFARMESALDEGDIQFALSFLKNFPHVNIKNSFGKTLLHLACITNNLEVAKELLKQGADPNSVSKSQQVPSHIVNY